MNAAKEILDQQRSERDYLGEILFNALRDNMPWGLIVELPNGAKATLVKMNGQDDASQPKRMPIYLEGTSPVEDGAKPIGYHPWSMTFDFKLANCDQDHIEVTAEITGGGGFAQ